MGKSKIMLKINKIIIAVLCLCFCLIFSACDKGNTGGNGGGNTDPVPSGKVAKNNDYSNPIYPLHKGVKTPVYTADPYVIRGDDGNYYLYCTQTEVYENDDAIAPRFKRGPVFKSEDCVNWVYVADVFANYVPDWVSPVGSDNPGVWAPTVVKVGEYYNFYYSFSVGSYDNPEIGIGVARSQTPYGPYEHFGKLFNSGEIGVINSIDPHVLWDDGKLYMVFGSYGGLITLIELEEDGLSLKGGVEYQKEHKVALAGYERYEMNNYEASIILKKNGKYYLFLSTGTTLSGLQSSYRVVVASSDNIAGPYKDSNGKTLFGPNKGNSVVAPTMSGAMGVGHMCLTEDDAGDIWMLYHGYDTKASTAANWRVLYLDRLVWNSETHMPQVEDNHASNHEVRPGPYINKLEENQ